MKKEIRDGKVGVIRTNSHAAGWYSWHNIEDLIFDPSVVYMVEQMNQEPDSHKLDWVENIIAYCESTYGTEYYFGGADNLIVEWLEEGTEFLIEEYDGKESILIKNYTPWIKA